MYRHAHLCTARACSKQDVLWTSEQDMDVSCTSWNPCWIFGWIDIRTCGGCPKGIVVALAGCLATGKTGKTGKSQGIFCHREKSGNCQGIRQSSETSQGKPSWGLPTLLMTRTADRFGRNSSVRGMQFP